MGRKRTYTERYESIHDGFDTVNKAAKVGKYLDRKGYLDKAKVGAKALNEIDDKYLGPEAKTLKRGANVAANVGTASEIAESASSAALGVGAAGFGIAAGADHLADLRNQRQELVKQGASAHALSNFDDHYNDQRNEFRVNAAVSGTGAAVSVGTAAATAAASAGIAGADTALSFLGPIGWIVAAVGTAVGVGETVYNANKDKHDQGARGYYDMPQPAPFGTQAHAANEMSGYQDQSRHYTLTNDRVPEHPSDLHTNLVRNRASGYAPDDHEIATDITNIHNPNMKKNDAMAVQNLQIRGNNQSTHSNQNKDVTGAHGERQFHSMYKAGDRAHPLEGMGAHNPAHHKYTNNDVSHGARESFNQLDAQAPHNNIHPMALGTHHNNKVGAAPLGVTTNEAPGGYRIPIDGQGGDLPGSGGGNPDSENLASLVQLYAILPHATTTTAVVKQARQSFMNRMAENQLLIG